MLRVLGDALRLCDRVSRRELLRIGGLGTLGLGLPQLLEAAEGRAGGRRKSCILVYMWGGPAHQDVWDMKPEGPSAVRGEFRPIATSAPGIQISEHFPRIARHGDKLAIVRSVTHEDNNHSTSAHAMLTGRVHRLKRENFGPSPDDFPHFGSVLSKLRPSRHGLPTFVALPERIKTTNGPFVPGQGGGLLGKKYDPFTIDQHPDEPDFEVPSLRLPEGMTVERLEGRRKLLGLIDETARELDRYREVEALGDYYAQALDMIVSPEVRQAFDLASEDPKLRDRYGRHTFGQSCLLARRLIEAGVGLVTVYWHREKPGVDTTWDTHGKNFPQLKDRLMPPTDEGFSSLLEDLADRGLLDDTVVLWSSEFGRTPRINKNGGRDHWGKANSVVFAGGGVPGGQVYGATDDSASEPVVDPVSPDDVAATLFRLLGFAPETEIHDNLGRPLRISTGRPIGPVLGS